jgi:hypothetical protein
MSATPPTATEKRPSPDVDEAPFAYTLGAGHGAHPRVVVPILPAKRAVRRIGLPVDVERCRGVLRGAQRQ